MINKMIKLIDEKWFMVFHGHLIQYGYNNQLTVLAEECMELAKACLKIKRCIENHKEKDIKKHIYNFHEEYVDVFLMLLQFSNNVDPNMIDIIEGEKYIRACERIGIKP